MNDPIRLNKFLALCGVGSRRKCDELIQAGRIEVNGSPCLNLGTKVSGSDHVRLDGKRVTAKESLVIAFHKPRGFVCTRDDERSRDTIYSLLPGKLRSLHHVGRLDLDSEGLLILTNDGDLSQRLMHPSKSVEKEYLVTADQSFQSEHIEQFLSGIFTPEGKLKAKAAERISPRRLRVVLDHGAKRQIRVMFEALGYRVIKLLRVRIGDLWLGDLEPGRWAILNAAEIEMLSRNPPKPKAKVAAKPTSKPPQAPQAKPPTRSKQPADSKPRVFQKSARSRPVITRAKRP